MGVCAFFVISSVVEKVRDANHDRIHHIRKSMVNPDCGIA